MAGFMADAINIKTLTIEPEMLDIIGELDEFKGAWRALGALAPERLSALRHVATIESIGSSTRIEGSKLSNREIEKLLVNIEIKSFKTRDEQEVAGYAGIMETIFASWSVLPLTENHIKQLPRVSLTRNKWPRGAALGHLFLVREKRSSWAFDQKWLSGPTWKGQGNLVCTILSPRQSAGSRKRHPLQPSQGR